MQDGVCRIVFNQQMEFAAGEPLIGVSATGQTQAAVNITFEVNRRYPQERPIAITSLDQSRDAAPKHPSGKTLYHVVASRKRISGRQLYVGRRRLRYGRRARAGVQGLSFLHRRVNRSAFTERPDDSRAGAASPLTSGTTEYASCPDAGELRRGAREPAPALCEGAVEPAGLTPVPGTPATIECRDNPSIGGRTGRLTLAAGFRFPRH